MACVTLLSDRSWPTTSCNWFRTFFTDIVAKSLFLRILSIWTLNCRISSSDSPMLADKSLECDAISLEELLSCERCRRLRPGVNDNGMLSSIQTLARCNGRAV